MDKIEKKLWKKVNKYVPLLKHIPFLRYVAICNNLSFSKVNENSDIDIFIITKSNRIFFVRTLVTLIFHILGVRRHGKHTKNRFCLSFFIDENSLDLSKLAIKDDIYLALWIYHQKVIIDDGVSTQFIKENKWVERYIDNFNPLNDEYKINHNSLFSSLLTFLLDNKIGDFIEHLLSKWQIKRAKSKASSLSDLTGTIITNNILKFHNNDRRHEYKKLWYDKYTTGRKVNLKEFKKLLP